MQFPSGNDWTPSIDPRDYSQKPLTIIEESIKRKQKQTAAPPPHSDSGRASGGPRPTRAAVQ